MKLYLITLSTCAALAMLFLMSLLSLMFTTTTTTTPQSSASPLATVIAPVHEITATAATALAADDYYDIGQFHCAVSTDSPLAQLWFDRGLAMCYGFNHEEAASCFEKAIAEDPGLPMAYWGLAYALGPNMNHMQIAHDQMGQAAMALRIARLHLERAQPWERGLIEALLERHPQTLPNDLAPLNEAYAAALRKLHAQHEDNPTVVALFAESLTNLHPWNAWAPDGTPAAATLELVSVIERALEKWPAHPMLCHLYIHAMEASPTPEKALEAANRLRNAMPGLGHLVHMPSHIDIQLGDYNSVVETNARAITVDDQYVRHHGRHNFYTLYRVHNHHFLVYGAMFDGQSRRALKHARQLVDEIPEQMLQVQVDSLDGFVATAYHVMIRFGMWDEILKEPKPRDFLPMTGAMWHYARGLACAATNQVEQAAAELALLERACQTIPESSMMFNNSCRDIARIAQAMLKGEIAYRQADYERAFGQLRMAVQLDDALHYDEPWGWMQPARHALGALLLEQGRAEEAEPVFRADLQRHPHNAWSLLGLRECLELRGDTTEVNQVKLDLEAATRRADIVIDRSCYCRLKCCP